MLVARRAAVFPPWLLLFMWWCEAACRLGLTVSRGSTVPRPTALLRSNATGGKGQRSRQPALPSQSLYASALSMNQRTGCAFLRKIPDRRCKSTSRNVQAPIKEQPAGLKPKPL